MDEVDGILRRFAEFVGVFGEQGILSNQFAGRTELNGGRRRRRLNADRWQLMVMVVVVMTQLQRFFVFQCVRV